MIHHAAGSTNEALQWCALRLGDLVHVAAKRALANNLVLGCECRAERTWRGPAGVLHLTELVPLTQRFLGLCHLFLPEGPAVVPRLVLFGHRTLMKQVYVIVRGNYRR